MQSVSSWLRGWSQDGKPPDKPECMIVTESLLMELEYQINEAVMIEREKEQEERRKATGVDYSWLITQLPKTYEIPELDKLELEELCMKIQAKECGTVISEFRKTLLQQRKPEEIPRLMRAVILQVIEMRPKEDTMSEWVMKGITKLRPSSAKITPVNYDDNLAPSVDSVSQSFTCDSYKQSHSSSHDCLQHQTHISSATTSSVEDLSQPVFIHVNRIEDLPV